MQTPGPSAAVAAALMTVLPFCAAHAAKPAEGTPRAYRVTSQSELVMTDQTGGRRKATVRVQTDYRWFSKGQERTLILDQLSSRFSPEGQPGTESQISRNSIKQAKGDQTKQFTVETAPEQVKALMTELFGSPLLLVSLDANGQEKERKFIGSAKAKESSDERMLTDMTFFHSPVRAETKWETPATFNIVSEGLARGTLSYEKQGTGPEYAVRGTLTTEPRANPDGTLARASRYVVAGTQTADAAGRTWVAGKFTIDARQEMEFPSKNDVLTTTGTIVTTFEAREK